MSRLWAPGRVGLLVLFGITLAIQAAVAEEDIIHIAATGESEASFDVAKEKALRNAVREACGVAVSSDTRTADFTLISDTIYSRAAGNIVTYTVLEQKRGADNAYIVRVAADVSRRKISDNYLAVRTYIELAGRPQFVVSVDQRAGSEQGVGAWVEGAMNDYLEKTGFTTLYAKARDEAVQRQYMQAVEAGDKAKAHQLRLQMGAPYGVHIVALGKAQWEEIYGTRMRTSTVEMQVTVVHRDSAQLLASKGTSAKVVTGDLTGMQLACKRAMEEVFPQVLDRILSHWSEDIDRGIEITVQLFPASFEEADKLAKAIKKDLADVRSAEVVEAPEGGIAVIKVVGAVKATDIASRIKKWTDGKFKASLPGPRIVAASPADATPPKTAP